jgi:hypothetical protein
VINILSSSRINLCHFVFIWIKADDLTHAELPNNLAHNQKSWVPAYLSYILNKLCETFDHGPLLQVHFHGVFQSAPTLWMSHLLIQFTMSIILINPQKMCLKLILQVTWLNRKPTSQHFKYSIRNGVRKWACQHLFSVVHAVLAWALTCW